jgi:hypothetical protein
MAEVTKYARIRLPKNKKDDVPKSFKSRGIRIVQGGTGVPIKDEATIKHFRNALGSNLEVSNSPFSVESKPKGGIVMEPGKNE